MMLANDVVKNGQIGLCATHDNRIIKRLHVPINGICWKEPDLRSGLILGDLTAALSDIENIGVKIRCVDLDIMSIADITGPDLVEEKSRRPTSFEEGLPLRCINRIEILGRHNSVNLVNYVSEKLLCDSPLLD